MPDTITPEPAEKYSRQTIAINRIVLPLGLALCSYWLWVDAARWHHNAGSSYGTAFALHAVLCALWIAAFLVVTASKKIFSRSYRPQYDPKQYDLFASFTVPKFLMFMLCWMSYFVTYSSFEHGAGTMRDSASFLKGETLFAMAGTLTLNLLLARRILRKHKQAHHG